MSEKKDVIKPIRNPFTGRDNFPDFDEAITSSSSEWPMPLSSSTRDIRSSRQTGQRLHRPEPQQQQHHQSFESAAVDVSMCSHASLSQLSIGARACLNEHLRHVAKFGLDDSLYAQRMDLEDHSGGEADHVTGSSRSSRKQRDPRDLLWEKLVDAPAEFTVDQDYSGSSDIIVSPVLDEDLRQYYDTVFANSHGDVQQDVEVMAADQSTDFFNSSRVWLLTTPDRNRAAQIHAVTSRQSHPQQESLILDESFTHSLGNDGVELGTIVPHMFPPPAPHSEVSIRTDLNFLVAAEAVAAAASSSAGDNSFSLSGVDISRISAEGSEDGIRRSPDTSIDQRTTIDEMRYLIPPDTPNRQSTTSSPSLPLRRFQSGAIASATTNKPHSSVASTPPHHPRRDDTELLSLSPIAQSLVHLSNNSSNSLRLGNNNHRSLPPKGLWVESQRHPRQLATRIPPRATHAATVRLIPATTVIECRRSPESSDVSTLHTASPDLSNNQSISSNSHNNNNDDDNNNNIILHTDRNRIHENRHHPDDDRDHPQFTSSRSSISGTNTSIRSSTPDIPTTTSPLVRSSSKPPSWMGVEDRRRYRTVVPSRVFLTETDDFPEQYDSFSAPPLLSHTAGASLLISTTTTTTLPLASLSPPRNVTTIPRRDCRTALF